VTHTMSATSTLPVHPTRSVRRTSGLVLVGYPEVGQRWRFWEVSRGDRRSETGRCGEDYTLQQLLSLKDLVKTFGITAQYHTPLLFLLIAHDSVPLDIPCFLTRRKRWLLSWFSFTDVAPTDVANNQGSACSSDELAQAGFAASMRNEHSSGETGPPIDGMLKLFNSADLNAEVCSLVKFGSTREPHSKALNQLPASRRAVYGFYL